MMLTCRNQGRVGRQGSGVGKLLKYDMLQAGTPWAGPCFSEPHTIPPCTLQASAGMKLFYTSGLQGEAPEVLTIGRPSAGKLQAACDFSASDVVESGANYNNNRCNGGSECRWGKLKL